MKRIIYEKNALPSLLEPRLENCQSEKWKNKENISTNIITELN